eukprot:7012932-Alexandrium_andersonii.AAC.1
MVQAKKEEPKEELPCEAAQPALAVPGQGDDAGWVSVQLRARLSSKSGIGSRAVVALGCQCQHCCLVSALGKS